MTAVCPRCRAPLYGPVCQMCGARFDAPAPAPGYMPYPPPYGMAPQAPPTKRMAVVGGILSLVASAIVIGIAAIALANHDVTAHDAAPGFIGFAIAVAVVAAVFSLLAIRGAWWGSLVAGILQSVQVLGTLMCVGAIAEVKDRLKIEDLFAGLDDSGVDPDRIHALDTLAGLFVLAMLVVLVASIFSYIGIPGAKRWKAARASMQATSAFQ